MPSNNSRRSKHWREKKKSFWGSFLLKYGLYTDRRRSGLWQLRQQGRRKCQSCFLLFLWYYLDPIKCVNFRYKQLEMGPEKCDGIIEMWAVLLGCAFLTAVSLCDGCTNLAPSLVASSRKCALCLMHGFHSYVFICSGRAFSAVKSLWNRDFTVCWTSGPLDNQGPGCRGVMCSAGSWIFRLSLCSACLGHQSCWVLSISLLLQNMSNLHSTFSAHWVWKDVSKQARKPFLS